MSQRRMVNDKPSENIDNVNHTDASNDTDASGLFVWTASELKIATQAVNGEWYIKDGASNEQLLDTLTATRITTDTRKIQAGDIFLALVGDNFDGHDFIKMATDKGAVAAIVIKVNNDINLPQLKVEDTRLAFGRIATYRRQHHPNLNVIALTGSSGKTTVKEMLRHIFLQADATSPHNEGQNILVTRGNLNNDIGVPMMLLELSDNHQYAILELGANHVGEIAYVADMVKPDVACVLNVGTAHLGEFGGRDNIAKTKAEIYPSLNKEGVAIVPAHDDYTEQLTQAAELSTKNIIFFGRDNRCDKDNFDYKDNISEKNNFDANDIYATNVVLSASHSAFDLNFSVDATLTTIPVHLPLAGEHNVTNALAAAACAYAIGLTPKVIAEGLGQVTSGKGRLYHQKLGRHHIIDDTYNANPDSVKAAADVLAAQSGTTILILGDIGELGDAAMDEHYQLGHAISQKPIDRLLCVGEFSQHTVAGASNARLNQSDSSVITDSSNSESNMQAQAFNTKAELLGVLKNILAEEERADRFCTLLIKGSRFMAMETLIADLTV